MPWLSNRKRLLIGSSIYHIAQDIPNKFKYFININSDKQKQGKKLFN